MFLVDDILLVHIMIFKHNQQSMRLTKVIPSKVWATYNLEDGGIVM